MRSKTALPIPVLVLMLTLPLTGCAFSFGTAQPQVTTTPGSSPTTGVQVTENPPVYSGESTPLPKPACPDGVTLPDRVAAESCGPIPADADPFEVTDEASLLRTPDKNIECELREDAAYCQAYDYTFSLPTDEYGNPSSAVAVENQSSVASLSDSGESGFLVTTFGQAFYAGPFVCRAGVEDMTCWNSRTGHGFQLSRTAMLLW